MQRIRTIQQAIDEIKAADPNTALTYHCLRESILNGELSFIPSGKKRLIDMDTLEDFLKQKSKPITPIANV